MCLKLLTTLLLLINLSIFGQTKVDGKLEDKYGKPIINATIILSNLENENIVNYAISNEEGYYNVKINSNLTKLNFKVNSIGFKTEELVINNKTQTLNFILTEEVNQLKEVVLKSTAITRRDDTLNYSVNSFSKPEDRTIADVLRNMPGIEVLNDGRILYQGKAINKYYIEGLDLLEGKYNLANKNLPHKEVVKIQVLENHQPIRLLDSLVFSDQAAINIKLKNTYTFTGQAELGSGFSPLLWDVNATPMLFSKKRQMLSSYQANNTGDNVANQIKALTIQDLLDQFERNDEKQDWLSIQQLNVPDFSEKRWLDNNIHLITTNYLQKLKKDYELRLNLSYLNDYQQQNGFTNTQFFTPNDTIALFENKYNQLYTNSLETNLTFHKNTDNNFFKNSLKFNGFWDSQRGTIQLATNGISQNLSNRYFKLSNDLKTVFPIGKQIATLKSYVGLSKTPQSLSVNPGQFNNLLNDGDNYEEVKQDIELNTVYTNNSLGFTKGWKTFSFSTNLGIQFEKQNLESSIFTSENLTDNFENNLDWTRSKLYLKLLTQYQKNKWRVELTTPLNFHSYQLNDIPLEREQNLNRVTFEPRLYINYDLTSFWRIRSTAKLSNQFGSIDQMHYNYILKNYRNLQRIDAPLPEIQKLGYSTSLGYRNPIKSLFFNVNYSFTKSDNNLLYNSQILDNGATELQAIEQANERLSHNFSTRVSKYFSELDTNLTLSANYSLQSFQQILNSQITDIANQNWRLNGKIDTDIFDWLNAEVESTFQFSNNQIQNQENQTIAQQFHKFNTNIYPDDNHYIGINTEYINNNLFSEDNENFFADLIYRYTWQKKNIDFEVQLNNIFNTEEYRAININDFSYVESNFRLRPRQVLFKIRFSL